MGLGVFAVGAFLDDELNALLGMDGKRRGRCLYACRWKGVNAERNPKDSLDAGGGQAQISADRIIQSESRFITFWRAECSRNTPMQQLS
jgi:hypothetical protein